MNNALTDKAPVPLGEELKSVWNQLPNKGFFFVLLAAWLALFQFLGNSVFGYLDTHSLLYAMWKDYTVTSNVSDDSHGVLIPFVVLVLFWWKRDQLLALPLRAWWPGILILALGVVIHMVGYAVQQPRISIIGLFVGIYGLMGLAWGPDWLRASFFPYFLFGFCVPLGTLVDPVTFPLRLMVSKLVAFIGQNIFGIVSPAKARGCSRCPSAMNTTWRRLAAAFTAWWPSAPSPSSIPSSSSRNGGNASCSSAARSRWPSSATPSACC
jgi:hypothetical protein